MVSEHIPEDFTFWYGTASGSQRKALRKLIHTGALPGEVMISQITEKNEPLDGVGGGHFIDCGGYSFMRNHDTLEYPNTVEDYCRWVKDRENQISQYAWRDIPGEPQLRERHGTTIEEHQELTTQMHIQCKNWHEDLAIDAQPVAVIQGWDPEDYLSHLDDLQDHGLADTGYLGIGSVCNRGDTQQIRDLITTIRSEVPDGTLLHAFGIKTDVLQYPGAVEALDSSDSLANSTDRMFKARKHGISHTWRNELMGYMEMWWKIHINLADAGATMAMQDAGIDTDTPMFCQGCGADFKPHHIVADSHAVPVDEGFMCSDCHEKRVQTPNLSDWF